MLITKITFVLLISLSVPVFAANCEQESQERSEQTKAELPHEQTEKSEVETPVSSESCQLTSYQPILQALQAELDLKQAESARAKLEQGELSEKDEFDLFLESFDEEVIAEVTLLEKAQAVYSYVTATLYEGGSSVKKHITYHKMAYSGMLSSLLLATGIYCVKD